MYKSGGLEFAVKVLKNMEDDDVLDSAEENNIWCIWPIPVCHFEKETTSIC